MVAGKTLLTNPATQFFPNLENCCHSTSTTNCLSIDTGKTQEPLIYGLLPSNHQDVDASFSCHDPANRAVNRPDRTTIRIHHI